VVNMAGRAENYVFHKIYYFMVFLGSSSLSRAAC
jgi:hypothetical protein